MAALGRAKSDKAQIEIYGRLLQHLATFRHMTVLGYDRAAADVTARLRGQRIRIGSMDLKIASIVLAADGTLITRNVADFEKVADLRIEDWSVEAES